MRTVPRNRIWTFRKTLRHGRHVFFFPRMRTMNAKRFLIGQTSKPIITLLLFVGRQTLRALRMTPSWRKTNMAASSFQSMRNFWKEFSLPELQVGSPQKKNLFFIF